ncbi:MAG TPA: DinB family protein [Mycobacteriales bacterium]|nr:DinB family protein [Mycobacteriales bacterium]
MNSVSVLEDAYGRIKESIHGVANGLSDADLLHRLDRDANPIGWLIWHVARVQDDHVVEGAAGGEQVWVAHGWSERLDLPYDVRAHGWGMTSEEVGQFDASVEEVIGYYDAVHEHVLTYLDTLTDTDLDRIVDTRWDPPVTLGVRLVSVLDDSLEHAGQAAYIRGILDRR